ncbi:cell division protein ZipA [Hahella sp. CCB-MM4]|nr:cell division protein ZipA [Hahella sp. CCB-MM4]
MSLREWLIILGVLIIILVVLDGVRRARRARRDSMEISQGMGGNFENTPLDDNFNPELPGGGFRVVRNGRDTYSSYDDENQSADDESLAENAHQMDEDEREWDEPVSEDDYRDESRASYRYDSESYGRNESEDYERDEADEPYYAAEQEPEYYNEEPLRAEPHWEDEEPVEESASLDEKSPMEEYASSESADPSELHAEVEDKPVRSEEKHNDFKDRFLKKITSNVDAIQESLQQKHQKHKSKKVKRQESRKSKDSTEEIIVVNVLAKAPEGFEGSKLRHLVEACGMQLGEMSIYHRHEYDFDKGPVQFSMANAVKPGTFGRDMDDTTTPGVSFFIRLPGPDDSMQAFDYMIETAQCIVRNLDGELKDENLSVMTSQTIEHCRQRVREFERKQLSSKV